MTEAKKQISEQQLMQMAQQERQALENKRNVLEKLSHIFKETVITKETLKEMQTANGKVLVNLGASVLVELEANSIKKVKRGIAEHAYKEDSIEETIKWLSDREEKLQKQLNKLSAEYSSEEQKLTDMIGILKQIDAEKRKAIENRKKVPTISK